MTRAEVPIEDGFEKRDDANLQSVRYRLISMFGPDGLWTHHNNRSVFQPNEKGQDVFVKMDGGKLVPGSASPPWGWNDPDDRNRVGDFAWDPAHLVGSYFDGLKAYGREYLHNPYLGIVR